MKWIFAALVAAIIGLGAALVVERSAHKVTKADAAVAFAQGVADAHKTAAARADAIAVDAVADRDKLLSDLASIAERGREVRTVWRERVRALPPLTCGPGPERVEAVNAALVELLRTSP